MTVCQGNEIFNHDLNSFVFFSRTGLDRFRETISSVNLDFGLLTKWIRQGTDSTYKPANWEPCNGRNTLPLRESKLTQHLQGAYEDLVNPLS